ncbi:MAG: hypothetical protein GW817_12005 [Flavobacteriales bacterium]|nr:hypothetical protein [Flavobacteriales bacterium]NCT13838.1 hypothetical protein [Flavobacteriales bacterium]
MPKAISVRLESLVSISDKCYKAYAFDGSEALIPKSQVFGQDYSVQKSEAYWISEWILSKNTQLQYSSKKWTIFTKEGKNIGQIEISKHEPEKLIPLENNTIQRLKK